MVPTHHVSAEGNPEPPPHIQISTFCGGKGGEPMHPRRETRRDSPFLLNAVDHLGRKIDSAILTVANEIAPRALRYAEKLIGDPAVAINLFEEAAATVSQALRDKAANGAPDIHDMRRYLFRVFLNRLGEERRAEVHAEDSPKKDILTRRDPRDSRDLDVFILAEELLGSCDRVTQEIILHRLEGCSWKEIERRLGIRIPAATQRYRRAVHHLREIYRAR